MAGLRDVRLAVMLAYLMAENLGLRLAERSGHCSVAKLGGYWVGRSGFARAVLWAGDSAEQLVAR